jgi:hypothetical protein
MNIFLPHYSRTNFNFYLLVLFSLVLLLYNNLLAVSTLLGTDLYRKLSAIEDDLSCPRLLSFKEFTPELANRIADVLR